LEDVAQAAPLSAVDSMEVAVARWFVADSVSAARYVAEGNETIQGARAQARTAILDQIRQAMQAVGAEAQSHMGDAAAIEAAAQPCQDAILVRSAVVEACAGVTSELCLAAADTAAREPYRFVDRPEDIWDVEDYRPWSTPEPLQGTPQGALVGARTAAQARRGNIIVAVALAPLIRNRTELGEPEIAEFEANLDSLGFTFEHPLFVMSPAIEVQVRVPAPIGGETHLLLHFGDLTGDDVIWSVEASTGGLLQAVFPASAANLARLRAGETVSLTAVRVPEGENPEAEPVYSVPLLAVGQTQNVDALLQYMASGGLSRDLAALVPPEPGAGSPGR
ncbi:MAG: hypothetical protein Q8N53_15805, partial [Longimicrobiales bacterium]|nr:hypothetical protein [Longimicrobiales bacterium]